MVTLVAGYTLDGVAMLAGYTLEGVATIHCVEGSST
jgi:hypothetical protein